MAGGQRDPKRNQGPETVCVCTGKLRPLLNPDLPSTKGEVPFSYNSSPSSTGTSGVTFWTRRSRVSVRGVVCHTSTVPSVSRMGGGRTRWLRLRGFGDPEGPGRELLSVASSIRDLTGSRGEASVLSKEGGRMWSEPVSAPFAAPRPGSDHVRPQPHTHVRFVTRPHTCSHTHECPHKCTFTLTLTLTYTHLHLHTHSFTFTHTHVYKLSLTVTYTLSPTQYTLTCTLGHTQ